MRVGLNLLHLVPRETGGSELYARRLVAALVLERDVKLTLFVAREAEGSLRAEPWADDVAIVRLAVNARSRARRVLAEQTLLPVAARRTRVDVLHNLFSTAPAVPRAPQVTTILDVIYKRYPETHAGVLSKGVALLVPLAARRSRRIVTISDAAKRDIVDFLGVDAARVDVTPLGPGLASGSEPVPEQELRDRFHLENAPLVLTVSAKRPHKNLERLLKAFASIDADPAPVLILPGYETAFEPELRRLAEDRVRFTGWLEDATLEGLHRIATCFVFPSLAEGFGLPVLDALARGVPVACSNASSLPEVAGAAAVYFDPEDTAGIASAVERLLRDEALREQLREAGPVQARKFSWERTARATVASYERALDGRW